MARPLSFRWDEEFVARIDAARGLVPRSAFVRSAVRAFLDAGDMGVISLSVGGERAPFEHPMAPAARAVHQPAPNAENVRSTSRAKRGVTPVPKPSKR